MYDYMIVGCGFAGTTLAERIASVLGKRVLIVEKRGHVGGNSSDYHNDEGILVHRYGPHIFHTDDESIFAYLSRFTDWRFYEHRVLSCVEGKLLPIPINLDTVNKLYGWNLDSHEMEDYLCKVRENIPSPDNSEEIVLSRLGRDLYEKFFQGYTKKMWGMEPSDLAPEVAGRIPYRTDRDDRYFTDRFQHMPREGFTPLFEKMLSSEKIELLLNKDYRNMRGKLNVKKTIYTGPLDEYFDCSLGKLPYRSLRFSFKHYNRPIYQHAAVINFPNDFDYTRITEYKYLTGQKHRGTTVSHEYPKDGGEPYYPVLTGESKVLAEKYRERAAREKDVIFVGRLAEYRYYTMEDVIRRALHVFDELRGEGQGI